MEEDAGYEDVQDLPNAYDSPLLPNTLPTPAHMLPAAPTDITRADDIVLTPTEDTHDILTEASPSSQESQFAPTLDLPVAPPAPIESGSFRQRAEAPQPPIPHQCVPHHRQAGAERGPSHGKTSHRGIVPPCQEQNTYRGSKMQYHTIPTQRHAEVPPHHRQYRTDQGQGQGAPGRRRGLPGQREVLCSRDFFPYCINYCYISHCTDCRGRRERCHYHRHREGVSQRLHADDGSLQARVHEDQQRGQPDHD